MITTIDGDMDEALLEKRTGTDEDDRARADWVEYWQGERLMHRSVSIAIKKGLEFNCETGRFS